MSFSIFNIGNFAYTAARSPNATDVAYASKVPTTTAPSGTGVVTLSTSNSVPSEIQMIFYGVGANNSTMSCRVIGWKLYGTLYVPVVLAEVDCILSAVTGVAGAAILDTEHIADTITLASGYNTTNVKVTSPTTDTVGHMTVGTDGFAMVEFSFKVGTATSANAAYAMK